MSTFLTEINKPFVKPIILFELDLSRLCNFFTPYLPDVYYIQLNGTYPEDDTGENFFSGAQVFNDVTKVGSVMTNDARLLETNSPMSCYLTENSFHFDASSLKLYLHCEGGKRPSLFTIKIGVSYGFRLWGSNSASAFRGQIYDDRILIISNISKGKDSFYSGRLSFMDGSIQLENSDGFFDTARIKYNGAACRFFFGFENIDLSDFRKVYSGYIKSYDIDVNTITFNIVDEREKLSKNIAQDFFSTVNYHDLKEENAGKPVPIVYGSAKKSPVIIVDENRSTALTSNYLGYVCKVTSQDYGIKNVNKIYIGTTAEYSTASTAWSQNKTNGTISIKKSILTKDKEVSADIDGLIDSEGNLIENGLHIIRDLLRKIYGINFLNDFYNLAHWDEANGLKTAYVISENKSLVDAIEDLCQSNRATFIIEDDGRYGCRIFYKYGASLATISHNDMLEIGKISYSTNESMSGVTVKFNPNFSKNDYLNILNDLSQQEDIFADILFYKTETFETFLTDATEVQEFATFLLDLYGGATKFIECKTFLPSIIREVGDILTITTQRPELPNNIESEAKAEIVNISKDFMTGSIDLRLRVFEELGTYLIHQGIYYGDNSSSAITNHSIVFGQNASKQIGSYSAIFGGTRRVSI